MSLQSNVEGLIAHWRTTTAGYNAASTRLEDQSGNGYHLPLETGTPDFTQTKDGHTGWKMHGDSYFSFNDRNGHPANPMPSRFTVVQVLHTNVNAGEQFYPFFMGYRAFAGTDDPTWETPTDTVEGTVNRALRARLHGTNLTFGDNTFGIHTATFTSNQWNVFVYVWEPIGGFRKIGVNTHVLTDDGGGPTQQRNLLANDEMRLGIKAGLGTITTSGGESLTSLQTMVWSGDVTDDPAFATLITALVADPST